MPIVNLGKYYNTVYKASSISSDDGSYLTGFVDEQIWAGPTYYRVMFSQVAGTSALLRFGLETIPAGSVINSAILYHYTIAVSGAAWTVSVRRLKENWGISDSQASTTGRAEIPAANSQVTWTKRWATPTNLGWAGANFAIASDCYATQDATLTVTTPASSTWYANTCTEIVRSWMNGAANNGLAFWMDAATPNTSQDYFSSSDPSNVDKNPYMVIDYTPPNIFLGMDY